MMMMPQRTDGGRSYKAWRSWGTKILATVFALLCMAVSGFNYDAAVAAEDFNPVENKRITIEYVNVPAFVVVDAICRQVGLNMSIQQDSLMQNITLIHKDTPLSQVLDELCLLLDKDWVIRQGTLVIVTGQNPRFRSKTVTVPITNTLATEVYQNAKNGGLAGAGIDVEMILDIAKNTITVVGKQDQVARAVDLIKSLDSETRQVAIDVAFIEIRMDGEIGSGMKWSWDPIEFFEAVHVTTGQDGEDEFKTGDILGSNFGVVGRKTWEFQASLEAAINHGDAKILNSTRLITRSGQVATLHSGEETPIITHDPETGTDTEFKQTGVQISVTPTIINDSRVYMNIAPTVSEITGYIKSQNGEAPITSNRGVNTTMVMVDGQWLVISGLIQDKKIVSETGVPGLKDIPLVGEVFKDTKETNQKTQMIVLIRPQIINDNALRNSVYKGNEDSDIEEKYSQTLREFGFKKENIEEDKKDKEDKEDREDKEDKEDKGSIEENLGKDDKEQFESDVKASDKTMSDELMKYYEKIRREVKGDN